MSRKYASVTPMFWRGSSGRELRGNPAAQAMALYLMTCPVGTMTGLFRVEVAEMAIHLGWTEAEVKDALAAVVKTGIAKYDEAASLMFLPEGARWQMQIRTRLSPKDKRMRSVMADLEAIGSHPFADEFRAAYLPVELGPEGFPSETCKPLTKPLPESLQGTCSDPDPVLVPDLVQGGVGGEPAPGGGPPDEATDDEAAVWRALAGHRSLADLAKLGLVREWLGSASMAGRTVGDVVAVVHYVGADGDTNAADGTPRSREDLRSHLSKLVTTWRGKAPTGHGRGRYAPQHSGSFVPGSAAAEVF